MATLKTVQLVLNEKLYDSLGRSAITTVPVGKQDDNNQSNASILGFISDFINSRDPLQPGNTWVNGGALTGTIEDWVDATSFCLEGDTEYAYTGNYFELDPTNRLLQSNLPGIAFARATNFSQPNYSISYYQNYLPNNLSENSPLPSMLATVPIMLQYQLSAQQTSMGKLGLITRANWQDFLQRPQASAVVDANNNYLLTTYSYQTGAGLSAGLPINSPNANTQAPLMLQQQMYLPNFFMTGLSSASNFYLQNQINALGQVVQSISPDTGSTVSFYDNYGRLRFSQTADQAAQSVVTYYLYDALNRLIEMGLFPNTWDIANFQQQTELPVTAQPANAVPQKQFVYDVIAGGTYDPNGQGKLAQVTTYGLTANAGTITLADDYVIETYSYDSLGRTIAVNVQSINTNVASPKHSTGYAYSGLNFVTAINYPDGFSVFYNYNQQGLVNAIGYAANTSQATPYGLATYTYNVNGQVVSETLADSSITNPNPVTTTFSYANSLYQLTNINVQNSQALLFAESLCYTDDANGNNQQGNYQDGNIQQLTYQYAAVSDADFTPYTMNYKYDSFNRLIEAGITPPTYGKYMGIGEVIYDDNGNCSSLNSLTSGSYTYNNNNQVQGIALRYDAGNVNYTYSASGLGGLTATIAITDNNNINISNTIIAYDLISAKPLVTTIKLGGQSPVVTQQTLVYDSRGERYQKLITNITTASIISTVTYIRGKGAPCLMEYDLNNNPLLHYIYGPLGLLAMQDPNNQTTYYNFRDHAGSSCMIYNAQTNTATAYRSYDCFGVVRFADDAFWAGQANQGEGCLFRYCYTGQEWDFETQLYNYHARQYDPVYLRRFLTPDPAHQFASPYVYVGNNFINATDPTGKILLIGQTNIHSEFVNLLTELPETALLNTPSHRINMADYYTVERPDLTPAMADYRMRKISGIRFIPKPSANRLNISVGQAGLAGAPATLKTEHISFDGITKISRKTRGLNIVEEVGAPDLGVRYLPDEVDHVSYMTLDAHATHFYSGPFNGCDFAVAYNADLGTTVFHSHFHSGGVGPITDSVTLQRIGISQAVQSLGYNLGEVTHYLPAARYVHMDMSGENDATGFIYGRKEAGGAWSFHVQAVAVSQATGATTHIPIRAIGNEL